jgi:hypothetical protein
MPPWWFYALALVCSVLLGLFAVRIFDASPPARLQDEAWKAGWWYQSKALPWFVYQFWFNLVGSLAGWCALWVLAPATWFTGRLNVTWGSTALAAVAFAGITGHLPFLLQQALVSVALVLRPVGKALEKLLSG